VRNYSLIMTAPCHGKKRGGANTRVEVEPLTEVQPLQD
jgi:hypothetical protein